MIFLIYCGFILSSVVLNPYVSHDTSQQLHVIFRHGDRNPSKITMYPRDPNINDTWAPEGLGQLTMRGKMRAYNMGIALRQRYDYFLGKTYTSDMLYALSTDYDRTKISLEMVLSGIFPPIHKRRWNIPFSRQTIPYNVVSMKDNSLMRLAVLYCPNFIKLYNKVENSEHFKKFWESNAESINYISEKSGVNVTNYVDLVKIYDVLNSETQTGRKIPEWTKKIYPAFLKKSASLFYELQTYTDEMSKFAAGSMLKKILADMQSKRDGTLLPKDRKIFLYSGHEYNVAYILGALKVFTTPHQPAYGSYVVLELHKVNNIFGVKILYQNDSKEIPNYLAIPGCDIFCPLDQFVELTKPVIPVNIANDICFI